MATNITPYKISIPPCDVDELNQKLSKARFPEVVDNGNWERGPPIQNIRRITNHWRESFSWPRFEEKLNQLPNYEATISVDGFEPFQLHFVHQKSPVPDAIPLVIFHGWPGSFYEVAKVLSLLTASRPAFHVVAPSLPNFGFSDRIDKPGFGIKQYAETYHKLMQGLGYEQYAAQGADWGSPITRLMGILYPESLRAVHLYMVAANPPPITAPISFVRYLVQHFLNLYTPQEASGLQRAQSFQGNRDGYFQIQKQRPNTIGVALADSPVGLLTWIYDKLVVWTDGYPWTDEEVCEWISLYWFSRAGPAASVAIYYEAFRGEWVANSGIYTRGTKMGFSYFPKEMYRTPSSWNKQLGDVVFEREHEHGGHFALWEEPEAIIDDLQVMFAQGGKARGAFKSKT
ncbi:alpha/beta-hydrolase [Hypoxylon sp. FL0543]|nr:alpha/beta-hydrolase [Hypoxylon sp. FL0543]